MVCDTLFNCCDIYFFANEAISHHLKLEIAIPASNDEKAALGLICFFFKRECNFNSFVACNLTQLQATNEIKSYGMMRQLIILVLG